jgi:uncharacterized peroxidase-related enzyme
VSAMDKETRTFLDPPEPSDEVQRIYDASVAQHGFVMNLATLWAQQPTAHDGLFALMSQTVQAGALSVRDRAILVTASAAARCDPYCSLAWGKRLAAEAGAEVAGAVLRGRDEGLDDRGRALASWARRVARDPNATDVDDVQALRDVGYDDAQIFAITLFVALRIAFSTVNRSLGAEPDRELLETVPLEVRDAVEVSRPVR